MSGQDPQVIERSRGSAPLLIAGVSGLVVLLIVILVVVLVRGGSDPDAGEATDGGEVVAGPEVPTAAEETPGDGEPTGVGGGQGDRVYGQGFSFAVPDGWHVLDGADERSIALVEDPDVDPFEVDNQLGIYLFDEDSIQTTAGFEPAGVCRREAGALSAFAGGEPEEEPDRSVDEATAPGQRLVGDEYEYVLRCVLIGEDIVYNMTFKALPDEAARVEDAYDDLLDSWEWE